MLTRASRFATLVAVEKVVKRPYKVGIEVRQTSDGYSVTLVARGTRPLAGIARALKANGYDYAVYIDSYGYVRLHIRRLSYEDIVIINKLVHENIVPKKTMREEVLLGFT